MTLKTRLARYFGLNFILLEILIVGAGGFVAYDLGRRRMIEVSEETSAAVANHLSLVLDQFYMKPWELSFETYPYDNPIANREFSSVIKTFVSGFNVERVSIYDKNYRIIFSTDSTRRGQEEPSNSMLLSALAGHRVSKLVKEQTPAHMATASGQTDHLLAYVPVEVRSKDSSSTRLAFALLLDVSDMYAKVEQLRNVILLSTMATGLALFIVVWLIAVRADRLIAAENRERMALTEQIRRQNDELENVVTQRTRQLRDAQAGLVQMEKMAATGQLAAGVAHEINNPVGIIQNRLELLLDDVKQGNTIADIESHLSMMHRNTDRISKIVSRLLSFARKSVTGKTPQSMNSVFNGVLVLVRKEIEKRGIIFEDHVAANLPEILGNRTELEQVFINLLVNAMDATERGGTIKVEASENNGKIEIRITDSGHGISPEHLSKIFDPFFTTKEVGVGTGLGLSITYRIVEDHGGSIEVKSEIGKGTQFLIIFPAVASQPKSA